MPVKKVKKSSTSPSASAGHADTKLVDMARTIGETLGTAAAKAEGAAKEIETFSLALRKSTLATTRKLYKRAKKGLRAGAASWKSNPRKSKAPKKRSRKGSGRGK